MKVLLGVEYAISFGGRGTDTSKRSISRIIFLVWGLGFCHLGLFIFEMVNLEVSRIHSLGVKLIINKGFGMICTTT